MQRTAFTQHFTGRKFCIFPALTARISIAVVIRHVFCPVFLELTRSLWEPGIKASGCYPEGASFLVKYSLPELCCRIELLFGFMDIIMHFNKPFTNRPVCPQ